MLHVVSRCAPAIMLAVFPLFCLTLALYLSHNPPHTDHPIEVVELTPPALVKKLPALADIQHIPERKQTFIDVLLPLIEWQNHELLQIREELVAMYASALADTALTSTQTHRLTTLRKKFDVTEDHFPELKEALVTLLRRADILPQDMVLAQAAAESGWGTSRFAVEANNLFGQWCYRPGCGLIPQRRPEGARHEVQKFASVNEALKSYYRNINTHAAYQELRHQRAALRATGEAIRGEALVPTLLRYSSRGQAYVDELLELIRFNDLANVTVTQPGPEEQQLAAGEDS